MCRVTYLCSLQGPQGLNAIDGIDGEAGSRVRTGCIVVVDDSFVDVTVSFTSLF